MYPFEFASASPDHTVAWENCWENTLRLPLATLAPDQLYAEAERLVQTCRSSTADAGIDWYQWQVMDGRLFVCEQLAIDPDDVEWQRIDAALAGAQAGLGCLAGDDGRAAGVCCDRLGDPMNAGDGGFAIGGAGRPATWPSDE